MVTVGGQIQHVIYGKGLVEAVLGGYALVAFFDTSRTIRLPELKEVPSGAPQPGVVLKREE